jgi:hypothetical protein
MSILRVRVKLERPKFPWLVDASDRLRLLDIKIEATIRRVPWGEKLEDQHVTALIDVIIASDRIRADVIKHLSHQRQRRAYGDLARSFKRDIEPLQDKATRVRLMLTG